jgi:hypothetical protein
LKQEIAPTIKAIIKQRIDNKIKEKESSTWLRSNPN